MRPMYEKFANGIIEGKTGEQAAIDAGYSPHTASKQAYRLLKIVEIVTVIARGNRNAAEKSELTKAFVLNNLMDIAKDAKSEDKYRDATSALGLLGKYLGLFIDRSEVTITGETMAFLEKIIGIIDNRVKDKKTRKAIMEDLAGLQTFQDD